MTSDDQGTSRLHVRGPLVVRLREHVRRVLLDAGVTRAAAVGVACSGGPDSAVLAHVVMACMQAAEPAGAVGSVLLVHVDHGLRADSHRDADVVRALARGGPSDAAGAPLVDVVVERVHVDRTRASLERSAREARYQVLDGVVTAHGLAYMLLAHTASDQAETVFMRMLRGTGVVGLAGIPAARGRYLRPLLGITRRDIEGYVAETKIPTVRDPSNRDARFFRNRVRHEWLPALRRENPNLEHTLCRIAESAGDQREVLEFAARGLLEQARLAEPETPTETTPVALSVVALTRAPAPVISRALALAAERAGGEPLSAKHVRALRDLLARPAQGTVRLDLPGLSAVREYNTLLLRPPARAPLVADLRAHELDKAAPDTAADIATDTAAATMADDIQVRGPAPPYDVRLWQPGDRMRPRRLGGHSRKLSDLFIDAKVPRRRRSRARVVVRRSDGVIEWAEHIGLAWASPVQVIVSGEA